MRWSPSWPAGRAAAAAAAAVLVQTIAPEARSIQFAARHDSDGFLAGELNAARRSATRRSSLIRVVCSATEPRSATAAAPLRERIEPPGASVLGPAPLFRLRGRARASS